MTLFRGQAGSQIIHDFHPPIPPSGLFWTVPIDPSAVSFDFDAGAASMTLTDLYLPDSVDASGRQAALIPAAVSLVMQWQAADPVRTFGDAVSGFAGSYREGAATIAWSAAEAGFTFVSDPGGGSRTRFAQIGRERTGVFAASG